MNNPGKKILEELTEINNSIALSDMSSLISIIDKADKIFLTGAGRSGLMLRAFSNRLMHLGYKSHMLGDISTPHTKPGDILIVSSGSGNSLISLQQVKNAIQAGLKIIVITANTESHLIEKAALTIILPIQPPNTTTTSLQPMGTLFEQSSLLFFDSIVLMLMEKKGETSDTMKARHANLE